MKEKITYFKELVSKYQDDECNLKIRFNEFEEKYNLFSNDTIAYEKAVDLSKEFTVFYKDFFNFYTYFFYEYHALNCQNKDLAKEYAEYSKVFLDSCNLNILKLNINYIQPLINKITIVKANKSIYWGRWSVGLGWASILIGVLATILSLFISADSDKSINGIKQVLLKQENILIKNSIILNKLDSLAKENYSDLLQLIENLPNSEKKEIEKTLRHTKH